MSAIDHFNKTLLRLPIPLKRTKIIVWNFIFDTCSKVFPVLIFMLYLRKNNLKK